MTCIDQAGIPLSYFDTSHATLYFMQYLLTFRPSVGFTLINTRLFIRLSVLASSSSISSFCRTVRYTSSQQNSLLKHLSHSFCHKYQFFFTTSSSNMPRGRGRSNTSRGGRKSQRNRRTPARFQNVATIDVTDSPPQESSAHNGDPTVLQSTNFPSDVITVSRSELADLVRSLQQQGNCQTQPNNISQPPAAPQLSASLVSSRDPSQTTPSSSTPTDSLTNNSLPITLPIASQHNAIVHNNTAHQDNSMFQQLPATTSQASLAHANPSQQSFATGGHFNATKMAAPIQRFAGEGILTSASGINTATQAMPMMNNASIAVPPIIPPADLFLPYVDQQILNQLANRGKFVDLSDLHPDSRKPNATQISNTRVALDSDDPSVAVLSKHAKKNEIRDLANWLECGQHLLSIGHIFSPMSCTSIQLPASHRQPSS
ncbi:uncharacterized protein LOC144363994 [Saccoglossus kowalevskii]